MRVEVNWKIEKIGFGRGNGGCLVALFLKSSLNFVREIEDLARSSDLECALNQRFGYGL